jgi:para-nitrobenzyl esterase
MNRTHSRLHPLAAFFAALALILATAGFTAVDTGVAAAASRSASAPIVTIDGGAVRGVAVPGGFAFRGLPYAAAPTGRLRWRPPSLRPRATVSATRPSSRRVASSLRASRLA